MMPVARHQAHDASGRFAAAPRRPIQRKAWRPTVEVVERILRTCPASPFDIAMAEGVSMEVFGPWFTRMRASIARRPHALACMKHLLELRAAGNRIPAVMPSDVARRADCLARAAALAVRLCGVWPFASEPPPYNPSLDSARSAVHKGGWDCNGKRASRGPHACRAQQRERAAIVDDDYEDADW